MYTNGETIDLYSLLPASSGWVLTNATAVNDLDQIVGVGTYNGQSEAYLLNAGFIVSNLNDSGPGSLRQAIENINQDPIANGPDQITFATNILGEAISLLSPLPAVTRDQVTITGPVTIDGTSASGDGLEISGDQDAVHDLTIQNFAGGGISITGNQNAITASRIINNGADGIDVEKGASNNTVGGTVAGGGNVINSNSDNGVTVGQSPTDDAFGNTIEGNSIRNAKLDIDLGDDGVTLNGSRGHTGPNLLQDYPVITSGSVPTARPKSQVPSRACPAPVTTFNSSVTMRPTRRATDRGRPPRVRRGDDRLYGSGRLQFPDAERRCSRGADHRHRN